jgi:type I restriction enzyme S subunit
LFQSYLTEVFSKETSKSKLFEIQSICRLLNGFAFKSNEAVPSSSTQLLRMGNLYENNLDLSRNPVFYPDSYKLQYSKFVIEPGDILISLTGTVGKHDYGYAVRAEESPVDLLLNQRLLKIYEINSSTVNSDYFLYFLHSNIFLGELYKSANGTRQANLSSDYIKKMKVPLCSIQNQESLVVKISEVKEECLAMKNNSKLKIDNLIRLKQSILLQAFRGELIKE